MFHWWLSDVLMKMLSVRRLRNNMISQTASNVLEPVLPEQTNYSNHATKREHALHAYIVGRRGVVGSTLAFGSIGHGF